MATSNIGRCQPHDSDFVPRSLLVDNLRYYRIVGRSNNTAILYYLAAECEDSPQACERFAEHFSNLKSRVCGDIEIHWRSETRHPYVYVLPDEISVTNGSGPHSFLHAAQLTEAGFRLYRHLLDAPDFIFALYGLEVDRYEHADILEEMLCGDGLHLPDGLIISKSLWLEAGKPKNLRGFRDGFYWTPYNGESINPKDVGENSEKLNQLWWELVSQCGPST